MAYLIFLVICGVWGCSFVLMKKAALVFSPPATGVGRVFGAVIVLCAVWLVHGARWPFRRADWLPLSAVTLVGYAWPYGLQPLLVARHGSAFIGMTVSFVPLATILVSIPWLGIYPTRRQLLGVVGALVCMAGLMAEGWQRSVPLIDLLLAASIPVCYALANTWIRRYLGHPGPLPVTLLCLAATGVVLLPLAASLPGTPAHQLQPGDLLTACVALALLGVFSTGLGVLLFNHLIGTHGPLFAGMVTYLVPLGALLWGWLDGEQVTPFQIACLLGVLGMVAYAQTAKAPQAMSRKHAVVEPRASGLIDAEATGP